MTNIPPIPTSNEPPPTLRTQLLHEAERTVTGGRAQDYGKVENNFATIASYWAAHILARHDVSLALGVSDVAVMMALLKLARLAQSPGHADSWIDTAGYAACGYEATQGYRDRDEEQGAGA